jgi:hypothetical protein
MFWHPQALACAIFIKYFAKLKLATTFSRLKDEEHFLLKENLRHDDRWGRPILNETS